MLLGDANFEDRDAVLPYVGLQGASMQALNSTDEAAAFRVQTYILEGAINTLKEDEERCEAIVCEAVSRLAEIHQVCGSWVGLLKQVEMGGDLSAAPNEPKKDREAQDAEEWNQDRGARGGQEEVADMNPLENMVQSMTDVKLGADELQRELARVCDVMVVRRVKTDNDTVCELKKALESQKEGITRSWDVNMHHLREQWKEEHLQDSGKHEEELMRLAETTESMMKINKESAQRVSELEAQNKTLLQDALAEKRKRVETDQMLRAQMDLMRGELHEEQCRLYDALNCRATEGQEAQDAAVQELRRLQDDSKQKMNSLKEECNKETQALQLQLEEQERICKELEATVLRLAEVKQKTDAAAAGSIKQLQGQVVELSKVKELWEGERKSIEEEVASALFEINGRVAKRDALLLQLEERRQDQETELLTKVAEKEEKVKKLQTELEELQGKYAELDTAMLKAVKDKAERDREAEAMKECTGGALGSLEAQLAEQERKYTDLEARMTTLKKEKEETKRMGSENEEKAQGAVRPPVTTGDQQPKTTYPHPPFQPPG